jgi:hypothetical protein
MKCKSDGKKGKPLSEGSTGALKEGLKKGATIKDDPAGKSKWDEGRKSGGKRK